MNLKMERSQSCAVGRRVQRRVLELFLRDASGIACGGGGLFHDGGKCRRKTETVRLFNQSFFGRLCIQKHLHDA